MKERRKEITGIAVEHLGDLATEAVALAARRNEVEKYTDTVRTSCIHSYLTGAALRDIAHLAAPGGITRKQVEEWLEEGLREHLDDEDLDLED